MPHLILTRKVGEEVLIGQDVILHVVEIKGKQVKLSFEAPSSLRIFRKELLVAEERRDSAPKE